MAALALAAGGAAALTPAPALAHASLVGADPRPGAIVAAPPAAITLQFSQAVSAAGPGMTVLSPAGRLLPARVHVSGAVMSTPFRAAGDGTYLVTWQVISADTHPSRGQLTFSVGRPSPVPAGDQLGADVGAVSPAGLLLQALSRWLHFLGLALGFGVVAFRVLVPPAGERARAAEGRLDRLTTAGIVLLLVAEPVALAAQAVSLGVVAGDLLTSSFGRIAGLRMGGALLLWAATGAVRQAGRGRAAVLAAGAALALVDGAASHRLSGLPDAAAFVLTAVHESAMAVWAGGLAAVVATRSGAARFARVALVSFAVLAVSGAALAVAHLGSPADVVSSAYGSVVAAKVVAVGAAATIAALGARRLEVVALAGVLALAALLVSLPPPR